MYRFCHCKYSFTLTCLWRKLESYSRVHRKLCIFSCSIDPLNRDIFFDQITIVLAPHAQHRTLLSDFFMKQYFFLNSNPVPYFMFFCSMWKKRVRCRTKTILCTFYVLWSCVLVSVELVSHIIYVYSFSICL